MITAHELARALLDGPDLPVALCAMGHSFHADDHRVSHGKLEVRELIPTNYFKPKRYIVIGHMLDYETRHKPGFCPGEWKVTSDGGGVGRLGVNATTCEGTTDFDHVVDKLLDAAGKIRDREAAAQIIGKRET